MNHQPIRILHVETDPSARRAVEFYLKSFNPKDIEIQSLAREDDALDLLRQPWHAVLIQTNPRDKTKSTLHERIKNRLGGIPIIDLGDGAGEMATSGAETTGDGFMPSVTVNSAALLRSIKHLIQRRRLERTVESLQSALAESSHIDELTGVWSHEYVTERIGQKFSSWRRYKDPTTLCMFQIHDFDRINSNYGFEAADDVLRTCGKIVRDGVRNTDFAGRMGRDHFCIGYENTKAAGALIAVQRLNNTLKNELFSGKSSENFTIEGSFGLAPFSDAHSEVTGVLSSARQAVKRALAKGPGAIELAASIWPEPKRSGPNILVVEDQNSLLDMCCEAFEDQGYNATATRTGRDAQQAIDAEHFDLCVVDLSLPDMDGRDLIRKLQRRTRNKAGIIAVTGDAASNIGELEHLGVSKLLHKPFSPEAIIYACDELIRRAEEPAFSRRRTG